MIAPSKSRTQPSSRPQFSRATITDHESRITGIENYITLEPSLASAVAEENSYDYRC